MENKQNEKLQSLKLIYFPQKNRCHKHWSYYEKPLKTHVVSNVLFKLRALKMIEEELKSLPSREPVNTELQGGIMSLV